MKIQINVELDGNDMLQHFIEELKKNNIDAPWKEGDILPANVKLQVFAEKAGKFIDFDPKNIKFIYNK